MILRSESLELQLMEECLQRGWHIVASGVLTRFIAALSQPENSSNVQQPGQRSGPVVSPLTSLL